MIASPSKGEGYAGICDSGALIAAMLAEPAAAAVVFATPAGFEVRHEVTVSAPPERAFAAIVAVGRWWSDAHTYSGKAANLTIDPRPGGCFCETLADGGVEHMRVVYVDRGRALRLTGGLGPLQAEGVSGALTWTVAATDKGSKVSLSYVVGGYARGGMEPLAPLVDTVLGEQVARYAAYVGAGR